jgi:hypothetical protein
MDGFWPIFFLAIVLKIPVFAALWLVWWAARAVPEPDQELDDGDGGFRRWRREPRTPPGPRRGPHAPDALPLPPCPPGGRFRVACGARPARVRDAEPATARETVREP